MGPQRRGVLSSTCVSPHADPLKVAGEYAATAQFHESRVEVLEAPTRTDGLVRSCAVLIAVQPARAEMISLDPPGGAPSVLYASNSSEPEQRQLLSGAAFQVSLPIALPHPLVLSQRPPRTSHTCIRFLFPPWPVFDLHPADWDREAKEEYTMRRDVKRMGGSSPAFI